MGKKDVKCGNNHWPKTNFYALHFCENSLTKNKKNDVGCPVMPLDEVI